MTESETADTLIAAETAALRRWAAGDPDGFLEICDSEVTYFDPFVPQRIDGLAALRAYYDTLRGQVKADHFELHAPTVVASDTLAVLSFNFTSTGGNDRYRWNCTEVYRRTGDAWRIVQTHWSLVQPG